MAQTDKVTLKDLIKEIDFRLTHLEDMEFDNRKLMIKLVKQGNTIVEFLKNFDDQMSVDLEDDFSSPMEKTLLNENLNKVRSIDDLISEFMERRSDLKDFEEELKKHKDKITPGQIGEA